MNIYLHELRANLKSTAVWTLGSVCLAFVLMLFYPVLKSDMQGFLDLINGFPEAVRKALGMQAESFTSPLGFYTFILMYITLMFSMQAANFGVGILSKEERDKTADFLMTKPVSRIKIFTMKLSAVLTLLAATNAVYACVSTAAVSFMSDGVFDAGAFALINLSLFLLQLVMLSIGLAVSSLLRKVHSVLPVSLGITFVFYAISAFVVQSDDDKMRFITPFQYFKPDYILENSAYELPFVITGAAVILVFIVLSCVLYKKRNIHSV